MLFETEKKAETFIKFNSSEIEEEVGYKPERVYFCIYCGGWHVTSQKEDWSIKSPTEEILELYQQEKEEEALMKAKLQALKKEEKALLLARKKEEEKALMKAKRQAFEKAGKALLFARKKEEKEALLLARKIEEFNKSLNDVERYIKVLKKLKNNKANCIEKLPVKYIEVSERPQENEDQYIEIFNKNFSVIFEEPKENKNKYAKTLKKAFVELEKVKSINTVYKKSEKRIKIAEKELAKLDRKIKAK